MISQARAGIIAQINANQSRLRFIRQSMVDDGFGGQIPMGDPLKYTAKVRISHESKSVPQLEPKPVGLWNQSCTLYPADYKTLIQEGDRFNYQGTGWEVGVVDTLSYGSDIVGYQAPIKEAASMEDC